MKSFIFTLIKSVFLNTILCIYLLSGFGIAQNKFLPNAQKSDSKKVIPAPVPQRGGEYFTTFGDVRALLVYVSFANDSIKPDAALWKANQSPTYIHTILDSTLAQMSTNGNFSHYFREMSFNQLKIYGDEFWVKLEKPKKWYVQNKKRFSDINRDALILLDEQIDFEKYDNWTFGKKYKHENKPDGIIDLVIVVHRESMYGTFNLHNGISIVQYGADIEIDNGERIIKNGFPGSGFTLDGGMNGFRIDRAGHEVGHKYIGAGHPRYGKDPGGVHNSAFWGLLFSRSKMINAYNRAWLGWSDLPDIIADSAIVTLADYLTTGDAVRVPIFGTADESFILENHQYLSVFDEPGRYEVSKGLYIYHVKGNGSQPRYDLEVADGRFNWENPYWIQNPWGLRATDSIPVFKKLEPNPRGFDALDALQTTKLQKNRRPIYFKHLAIDSLGTPVIYRRVFGTPLDAFRMDGKRVFSTETNPNTHHWDDITPSGISIEIISETMHNNASVYTVKIVRK